MKYTQSERLAIGKKIYEKKLNKETTAVKYGINVYTARDYFRLYKTVIKLAESEDSGEQDLKCKK